MGDYDTPNGVTCDKMVKSIDIRTLDDVDQLTQHLKDKITESQDSEKKKPRVTKARHWTFILYPPGEGNSTPENWKEIIMRTGCEACISPLHDKDLNATGEPKKPHYHVLISYGNTTTYNTVLSLTQELCATVPQHINSMKGAVRYLTHRDNPEKAQYDPIDIFTINGFDVDAYTALTPSQVQFYKKEIVQFIRCYKIIHYVDLLEICERYNEHWWDVASNNTLFFTSVVNSQWKKLKMNNELKHVPAGEALELLVDEFIKSQKLKKKRDLKRNNKMKFTEKKKEKKKEKNSLSDETANI